MALKDRLWASPVSRLLVPLSWIYRLGGMMRSALLRPHDFQQPVICVGNAVVGGAGKTPVTLALANLLKNQGHHPALVYKGYKRTNPATLQVDPKRHTLADVGDEPLMAAAFAPTFVAKTRLMAAQAAADSGADLLILDDGLQNPTVIKDLTFLVVDTGYGFGNGRILPAGPLRMSPHDALNQADAVILLGEGPVPPIAKPLFRAHLVSLLPDALMGKPLVAFAGIGRPEKFFEGLGRAGAHLVETLSFPDHHAYTPEDLTLLTQCTPEGAMRVTTTKDAVRLPTHFATPVPVQVVWDDPEGISAFLQRFFQKNQIP
jgi:tetraacyldisaccharide 4'-kinase